MKSSELPYITYIPDRYYAHERVTTLQPREYLSTFAKALKNTKTSPMYCLNGYKSAVSTSVLTVIDDVCTLIQTLPRMDAIHILKSLIKDGLDITQIHTLLEEMMETEATARFLDKKAKIVQEGFRNAISCPTHAMCIGRLLREFHELVS